MDVPRACNFRTKGIYLVVFHKKISLSGIKTMNSNKNSADLTRLNLVLRTIKDVNQLVIREKDRKRLLQGICDNLVKNRGYYNAWIALLDETHKLMTVAETGLDDKFLPMVARLKQGGVTQCTRQAIVQAAVVLTKDPVATCEDCPLSAQYAGREAMTVRLENDGKVYGLLCASVPTGFTADKEELDLFQEVADDVALALTHIELDETNKERKVALDERVKELNCLYSISSLIEKQRLSLEEIFHEIVDLIPPAWRHSEITSAKIVLMDQEFKTENFQETDWRQTSNIMVDEKHYGALTVCYLEERPEIDEGPFLIEERALIDAIAERLGKIVERKQAERSLLESEKRFRDLVENSQIGILIIQEGQIIYKNPEQKRLFGPLPEEFDLTDNKGIHLEDLEKVKQAYRNLSSGKTKKMDIDFRFYPGNTLKSRSDMRWVDCRASLIEYRGKEALLVNMVDITRSKELEHLLIVQDKMASLGRVTAGIAHEIRNPLSGINIYVNTLGKLYNRGEDPEKIKAIFTQLQSASSKIESVIRRVMDFSKPGEPKFVLTDINKPIQEAIKLATVTLRQSGVTIDAILARNLKKCRIDPQMIEAVIFNLITNAADAMKNTTGQKRIEVTAGVKGGYLSVTVSDSGPGVPPGLRAKIFDPFYTTKPDGTGIGLSLCHRIMADHGGSIRVCTSRWGGAKFTIEIPIENGS